MGPGSHQIQIFKMVNMHMLPMHFKPKIRIGNL